jgi:hypothetical protein
MLFIVGFKEDIINVERDEALICPNCNKSGHVSFCALSSFCHIYHLPLVSVFDKSGFAECDNCDKRYWREYMPMTFRDSFETFFRNTNYPVKHFFIIWIIAGSIGLGLVSNYFRT